MENTTFSITELEDATKVNRRTIHYYSQKKIIPPPEGKGGSAKYGLRHYYSLILIKQMIVYRIVEVIGEVMLHLMNAVNVVVMVRHSMLILNELGNYIMDNPTHHHGYIPIIQRYIT